MSPDGTQRLPRRAGWDADRVRHDVRDYVVEQLGDRDGVLIADDTGFLKRATGPRAYSDSTRAAGRRENCQVGVFVAYASRHGMR